MAKKLDNKKNHHAREAWKLDKRAGRPRQSWKETKPGRFEAVRITVVETRSEARS